jgi:hypothetical protein
MVSLEGIDAAVARHYGMDRKMVLDPRPPRGAGVAVDLAAQLADMSSRAIGEHDRVGVTALRSEPWSADDASGCVEVVETLAGATGDKEKKELIAGVTL